MTIKPLGNRLVVKLIKQKNTSASGIILTTEDKNEQSMGTILSLGNGAVVENEMQIKDLGVKIGNTVLFGKYAGEEIKDETDPDTIYKILNAKDILAIIEN
jgi:chaperonin GroES